MAKSSRDADKKAKPAPPSEAGVSREQYDLLLDEAQAVERERARLEEVVQEAAVERARLERDLDHARAGVARSDESARQREDERRRLSDELERARHECAVLETRLERVDELRERVGLLEEQNNKLAFALKDAGDGYKRVLLAPPGTLAASATGGPAGPVRFERLRRASMVAVPVVLVAAIAFALVQLEVFERELFGRVEAAVGERDETRGELDELKRDLDARLDTLVERVGVDEQREREQAAERERRESERRDEDRAWMEGLIERARSDLAAETDDGATAVRLAALIEENAADRARLEDLYARAEADRQELAKLFEASNATLEASSASLEASSASIERVGKLAERSERRDGLMRRAFDVSLECAALERRRGAALGAAALPLEGDPGAELDRVRSAAGRMLTALLDDERALDAAAVELAELEAALVGVATAIAALEARADEDDDLGWGPPTPASSS